MYFSERSWAVIANHQPGMQPRAHLDLFFLSCNNGYIVILWNMKGKKKSWTAIMDK